MASRVADTKLNEVGRSPAAVIGAGPAGLIAAEILARAGLSVTVYDRMPSPARKFLLAGRSGLNLTHSEPLDRFLGRYGDAAAQLKPALDAFSPAALRAWAEGLGQETIVGSSGRVFPRSWKATPLLRAWLARLDRLGVSFAYRHRWTGFAPSGDLLFEGPDGPLTVPRAGAIILALGGASWSRLGSDGSWAAFLEAAGVAVRPLRPANAAVRIAWSDHFRQRFQGVPLKRIALSHEKMRSTGDAVVTTEGVEGGAVYPLAAALGLAAIPGPAGLLVDLRPDLDETRLGDALSRRAPGQSVSTWLRKAAALPPVAVALLREGGPNPLPTEPLALARLIKAVRLAVTGTDILDRAISSAGGIAASELDRSFMLKRLPGVFAAGEMLDWDAPTGGYLLQACFSTGVAAARGALGWLDGCPRSPVMDNTRQLR